MMFSLEGKNALVTGASGGIGGAIAKALHKQGAKVVLSGTKMDALEAVKKDMGGKAFIVSGNLSDPAVPATMIKEAEEKLGGGLDILVNNAGLTRDGLALRMKDEDWDDVINVNLSATFRLTRAVLKGMMSRRWGRVINITSTVGYVGNGGQANYAASKAGLAGLSKSLAQEMAPRNITVNCIAPGTIRTPMLDKLTEDQLKNLTKHIPTGAVGEPNDVAFAAVYLASQEAHYVTGQTLHVNGGMVMI